MPRRSLLDLTVGFLALGAVFGLIAQAMWLLFAVF